MAKDVKTRQKELRQKVYDFLLDVASSEENVEYISYIKAKE